MNVAEKLTKIAENTERVFLAGHLLGDGEGYIKGYEVGRSDGYTDGKNEGRAEGYTEGYDKGKADGYNNGLAVGKSECVANHFTQEMAGSGTTELVFPTPFKPDFISISAYEPTGVHTANAVAYFLMDVESFGLGCGTFGLYSNNGGFTSVAITTKSTITRFSWVNGETKIYGLNDGIFDSNLNYVVSASIYTDKPLRQRMEEFIRDMKSGASASFHRIKINEAFPISQEWEDLVATRPDCTITVYNV